jgi:hypothetical protein
MASHSVKMVVKARDEASKKLNIINKSALNFGKTLRRVVAIAGVYFGGRALKNFFQSSIEAAAEQEKADTLFAQSLRNVGEQAQSTLVRLKAYAGELQGLTVYGDESIQQLMSLALNLGITSDRMQEAIKGAMGLKAITGGRMGLEDAVKNVALAYEGQFTMLQRWIPELRSAETETEKMAVLQKKMAEGFESTKEEAMRGLGPIQQMKNAIGDVKEKIGAALLPVVQESAKRIKEWAEQNGEKIGEWAQKTAAYLKLVKDLFVAFGGFIRDDWAAAFRVGLDLVLTEVKAWGQSLMVIMEKIFADLENNVGVWIKRGIAKKIDFSRDEKEFLEKHGATGRGGGKTPEAVEYLRQQAKEYAREMVEHREAYGVYKEAFPTAESTSWQAVGERIKEIHEGALKGFVDRMPTEWAAAIQEAFSKLEEKLTAIIEGKDEAKDSAGKDKKKVSAAAAMKNKLPAFEARLLTMTPGAMVDPAKATEKNTREQIRRTRILKAETIKTNVFLEGQGLRPRNVKVTRLM